MAALKERASSQPTEPDTERRTKEKDGDHGKRSWSKGERTQVETVEADEFAALLKQSFKPRTERAATEVENAVSTLVQEALKDTSVIKSDVLDTIEEMIARIDQKLTAQMNEILHAPEFQAIESAWRGLHYLVFNSETDANLKIRVMNVSQDRALS